MDLYSGLNGSDLNGTWTLFIADLASGGGRSAISGAILSIVTVPEPSPLALAIPGGLLVWMLIRRGLPNW